MKFDNVRASMAVRVVANTLDAPHPTQGRPLRAGDIVTLDGMVWPPNYPRSRTTALSYVKPGTDQVAGLTYIDEVVEPTSMTAHQVATGVQARCLRNTCNAHRQTPSDAENESLKPGDIITLDSVDTETAEVIYWVREGFRNCIDVSDLELVTSEGEAGKKACICPPINFGWNGIGCKCGGA